MRSVACSAYSQCQEEEELDDANFKIKFQGYFI